MKRFLFVSIIISFLAVFYSVLNDSSRRENLLDTIEGSTGVNFEAEPDKILENAGQALGRSTGKALKKLGDTLTDPNFHRALKRIGRGAIDKLEEAHIEAIKNEIENHGSYQTGGEIDYEAIISKYISES